MSPLILPVIIPQITVKCNINWHRDFRRGMQLGGFWWDWTRWRAYTGTVVHKNPQILGQKKHPTALPWDV